MQTSKEVISEKVPELANDIKVSEFNKGEFLIELEESGVHVNINAATLKLINLIDGTRNIANIVQHYNESHPQSPISANTAYEVLYNHLGKYHIVKNDLHPEYNEDRASYLRFRMTLLKGEWIHKYTSFLAPLFNKKIFYPVLIMAFLFVVISLIAHFNLIYTELFNLSFYNWGIFILFFGISTFFHEIGHASSCEHFGIRHGNIGFGFYLFVPVMFADVTGIWKLPKKDRIVVNLAGMWMDFVNASIMLLLFYTTQNINFILIAVAIFMSTLGNINPFLRHDGYWVLSDLVDVPNLRKKSNETLLGVFNSLRKNIPLKFTKEVILFSVYALISNYIILLLILGLFLSDPYGIISFPKNIYAFFADLFSEGFHITLKDLKPFLIAAIFYMIILRYFVSNAGKMISRLKSQKFNFR
ncbi:hypothetical protein ACJD0Z_17440 [Flavobacteriaceae bacterium M23B6Z8]